MIIRILPMSDKETSFIGRNQIKAQKEFFEKELIDNNCLYHYSGNGLNEKPGALILFQYQGAIIASAILEEVIKYNNINSDNRGAYRFKENSIKTFKPISFEEFKFICPKILQFGQSKQRFDKTMLDIELLLLRIGML